MIFSLLIFILINTSLLYRASQKRSVSEWSWIKTLRFVICGIMYMYSTYVIIKLN